MFNAPFQYPIKAAEMAPDLNLKTISPSREAHCPMALRLSSLQLGRPDKAFTPPSGNQASLPDGAALIGPTDGS